jgi:tRNA(fMet)-specific endonuclease VapC
MKPTGKIMNATVETVEVFGLVKNNLKNAAAPILINVVWIAAHSIETGSEIVSCDAHFKNFPGLRFRPELG